MENELDQAEIHAPETNNMRPPKLQEGILGYLYAIV